ncbi:MAG: response regulator [Verrucomicrobiota bacterium]
MSGLSKSTGEGSYYVLFVDDEEKTRKAFERLFSDEFKILLAGDGAEGFEVFQQRSDEIGVIVTDQKMPRETGVQFLSKVAEQNDDIVRILSTAYAELEAAVEGVNKGGIYRYVTKPWDVPELEITLRRAMELFKLRKAQSTMAISQDMDMGQFLNAERVVNLAMFQSVNAQAETAGGLGAGSTFIQLLGRDGVGSEDTVNWSARFEEQAVFFGGAYREGAEAVSAQTALDWSRTTPPSAAVQAAAVGCGGFKLEFSSSDSSVWPGPAPLIAEVLRPLLVVLSDLADKMPGDACEVKGNFNTVDFVFPSRPLKTGLMDLMKSPGQQGQLSELLRALILLSAHGGRLTEIAVPEGFGLRLGFVAESEQGDPYAEVAKSLNGGE